MNAHVAHIGISRPLRSAAWRFSLIEVAEAKVKVLFGADRQAVFWFAIKRSARLLAHNLAAGLLEPEDRRLMRNLGGRDAYELRVAERYLRRFAVRLHIRWGR